MCGSWKAPDGSAAQTRVDARRLHFILLTMKQVMNALQAWALDQGLEHVRIDGATSLAHRHARLRLFNKNASVGLALVSVTAGGQGIDLTAASTAVFVQVRV